MAATLLPPNQTTLADALERTSEARYPLPVDLVSSVWDADRCPAHLLGYLAWQLSLDLWDDAWPEVKKRETCRKALQLHRLKTTPAGIKAHVALVGGTVKRIVRPPATGFMLGALTEEAHLAWLDSLPQVRIYPFSTPEVTHHRSFYSAPGVRCFYGPGYRLLSRGPIVLGRRATYYDRGVETDVSLAGLEGGAVERVFLRNHFPKRQWYGAGFYGAGSWQAVEADLTVITVRADEARLPFPVSAGLEPVDVRPQRISRSEVSSPRRAFYGRHAGFRKHSRGPLMIYDRIALNDPTRTATLRRVRSHWGRGRYGIAPFTAELLVELPMRRPRNVSGRWHGVGFRMAADMAPLRRVHEAVRVSKAFRDTVLVDTTIHRVAEFGAGLRFGDFNFGDFRKVA